MTFEMMYGSHVLPGSVRTSSPIRTRLTPLPLWPLSATASENIWVPPRDFGHPPGEGWRARREWEGFWRRLEVLRQGTASRRVSECVGVVES